MTPVFRYFFKRRKNAGEGDDGEGEGQTAQAACDLDCVAALLL